MKTKNVYGIELTEIQAMQFGKYLDNNPKLPAPNTINKQGRKQLVLDWLNSNYCQSYIEGNAKCEERCNHCIEYYKPLTL